MILVLEADLSPESIRAVEHAVRSAGGDPKKMDADGRLAIDARGVDRSLLGRPAGVAMVVAPRDPYPRVARTAEGTRAVRVGRATIGDGSLTLVAGPCAVESEEQLDACALAVAGAGGLVLRGGAYKPRSSPYSFQGLRERGLVMLREAADRHGLAVVTEVLDTGDVDVVAAHTDALQIGSRNMQNFALLRAIGKAGRPVLLKRGMSATLEDWLLAAEYVADAGESRIVLCERGVRTFDPSARNLLDLAAVPLLRARTSLPIVVDPSHGVGVRHAIPAVARAAAAIGADGVMLEVHPDPGAALSDGFQALPLASLPALARSLARVAEAAREPLAPLPPGPAGRPAGLRAVLRARAARAIDPGS